MQNLNELAFLKERGYLYAPKIVQIEVTNACPLHCPQCYKVPADKIAMMKLDVFEKHVEELGRIGVRSVVLIGGEPLLHKDISKMIVCARKSDMHVTIFTSGYQIEKLVDNYMQMDDEGIIIMVSANGSNEQIHSLSRDGFDITTKAMLALKQRGIRYGINWVARHDNVQDIEALIDFGMSNGCGFVNIVCNKINSQGLVISELTTTDYEHLEKVVRKHRLSKSITVQKCFNLLHQQLSDIHVPSLLTGCQAGISIASITVNSKYMPCLHLFYPEENRSMYEYWHNSPILKELRRSINTSLQCSDCARLQSCRFCKAMSLKTHVDFKAGLDVCPIKKVRGNV